MKIALYIADGLHQLVLTPESEHERNMLGLLRDKQHDLSIEHGSFYECQGGWMRHAYSGYRGDSNDSTMLVMRKKASDRPEPPSEGES